MRTLAHTDTRLQVSDAYVGVVYALGKMNAGRVGGQIWIWTTDTT